MRKLAFSIQGYLLIPISLFLLNTLPVSGQDHVISRVWSETGGIFATNFGIPTTVDANNNLYRAGSERQGFGGTDAKLQKLDEAGELLWSVTLNTSNANYYEPSGVYEESSIIYVTGIVTYQSNGETDFFVAKVDGDAGSVDWFVVDETDGNDISADIFYDSGKGSVYICGTSERDGTYDLLLASYDDDGQENWLVTRDYDTYVDVGAKVALSGSNLVVNGSSQPTATSWDIASWTYDSDGVFISETRSTGTSTSSDELSDGAVHNAYISLTGKSLQGADNDLKVICLDANNNQLWSDTFDKNNLEDEGTALVTSNNSFVVAGYVTDVANDEDIVVRKYNLAGTVLWSTEIDVEGETDKGVDIIEDSEGHFLVLSDVETAGQTDVYLHYVNGSTGAVIWNEKIANDAGLNENAMSIEATFNGEILVTYVANNLTTTVSYSYDEIEFTQDDEPFSKGVLYIANSGQLKDENKQSVMDVRYSSFGVYPDYYFMDDRISAVLGDYSNDSIANDSLQRIDFSFTNNNSTHVGQVEEFRRETHYNYYLGNFKYEQQETFDVLAYPGIYDDIDAFISSNSEGFKMTIVMESGADLSNVEMIIDGGGALSLSGGDLHVGSMLEDIVWLEPFSYPRDVAEITDDNCIEYDISNGTLKLVNTCSGEMAYPYVIQIRAGVGATYSTTAIANMDWSTFYGGNYYDFGRDATADANGNLYIAATTQSSVFPSNSGVITNVTLNLYEEYGLLLKFDDKAEPLWGSILGGTPLVNVTNGVHMEGVGLYDNLSLAGDEVHVVGESLGNFPPYRHPTHTPSGTWQQTTTTGSTDLYIASFQNSNGSLLMKSTFGSSGYQFVYGMDISDGGTMYFVGSTTNGSSGSSSQNPPPSHTFPVYDPGDGSYYNTTHAAIGPSGFVSAINLHTYLLDYSSIIDGYEVVYDINAKQFAGFCGRGPTHGRLGFFDAGIHKFATSITQTHSEWTDITYFSAVSPTDDGTVFIGINETGPNTVQTTPTGPQFQSTSGDAYLLRFQGSTLDWDTYFGSTADLVSGWSHLPSLLWVPDGLTGKGRLTYNSTTSTIFAAGSAMGNSVQTQSKTGFFSESVNSSQSGHVGVDIFIAAFASSTTHAVEDWFSWGTMYGGNEPAGFAGKTRQYGDDYVTGLVSYDIGNKSYLASVGSSLSVNGVPYSDVNKFPLADLGFAKSWYRPVNNSSASNVTHGSPDIIITRFDVTDIENGISVEEKQKSLSHLRVFPNPSSSTVRIALNQPIEKVKVYDLNGSCVLDMEHPEKRNTMDIDVSGLTNGVYLIEVNGVYNEKLVKL